MAAAIVQGIEDDAFEVVRANEKRMQMVALNRADPAAVDARFAELKPVLEEAVRDHAALLNPFAPRIRMRLESVRSPAGRFFILQRTPRAVQHSPPE